MDYPGNVEFRFVPVGSVAPAPPAEDELWLDVGNRVDIRVLDHHGGDSATRCAAEIVFHRFPELVPDSMRRRGRAVLVLHDPPDVDAVTSAWLTARILANGKPPLAAALASLVDAVGDHDQGMTRVNDPATSWPIVMRTILATDHGKSGNEKAVLAAFRNLDRTVEILAAGGSLEDAAHDISTPGVRLQLERACGDYLEDLDGGLVLCLALPHGESRRHDPVPPGPAHPLPTQPIRPADGLHVENPRCMLFREMARGDLERSSLRRGFSLLAVTLEVGVGADRPLFRHVITTDPLAGLHLRGLGALLEEAERAREDAMGLKPFPERMRLAPGKGRFGMGVGQPWYDGRGHGFTLVESPSVTVADKSVRASVLTPEEMLDVLARFAGRMDCDKAPRQNQSR
ncbi:MAG: hypothetical protein ACLFOY_14945 [Desulfatibacillaceae bacterium]